MHAEAPLVRALTWNVHGFVGRARRRDHDAVMHAVRELDADIVALQEVDERSYGPDDPAMFVTLREAFDWHCAEARTIRSPDGDYGHMLMSRWPMRDSVCIDLAWRRREPRMAISTVVESPIGDIRVVAAHLGLSARERREQLATIQRHLSDQELSATIVMGDFNEWRRIGAATKALCPPFEIAAAGPSFPARRPLFPLDRIWCRPPLRPVGASIAAEYRDLSDHLPVIAELTRVR
jgi:endonuclease/exonuclease/phosphatase family metal-dependent hydrolase